MQHRYDFIYFFDVRDGNPNGDPDAGNLPRVDPETGHGLVTDVCIKRKIRNFVALSYDYTRPNDIYVREKAVLGQSHVEAFKALGFNLGETVSRPVPDSMQEALEELDLPDGLSLDVNEDGENILTLALDVDKKLVQTWLKEVKPSTEIKKLLSEMLKGSKGRKPTAEETEKGREWMCANFFDIRTFGAVLSLKSAPNCGQVRGPVQLTFARSIDPIVSSEHAITRVAVATEAESAKQHGDNRTMGRKFTVPYGLYRAHGFISAPFAEKTGFTDADLDLLWKALSQLFDQDRSAARGEMSARTLLVFKHQDRLGNAPAHQLFDRIEVARRNGDGPARAFSDYEITLDGEPLERRLSLDKPLDLGKGVTLTRMI